MKKIKLYQINDTNASILNIRLLIEHIVYLLIDAFYPVEASNRDTLYNKICFLSNQKDISPDFIEILHKIRKFCNKYLHEKEFTAKCSSGLQSDLKINIDEVFLCVNWAYEILKIKDISLTKESVNGNVMSKQGEFIINIESTKENVAKDFIYTRLGSRIIIDKYIGTDKKVKIPSRIKGKNVTDIGARCFLKTNITSVIVPSTINGIGNQAFCRCFDLSTVIMQEGVKTIGRSSFENCSSLTRITLPSSITQIKKYAFAYCINLHEVTLSEGTNIIQKYAFDHCITLRKIFIPQSVTEISDSAFVSCDNVIIHGIKDSYANQYSIRHGFDFFEIANAEVEECS